MVCPEAGALGWEGTVSGLGLQAPVTEPAWCSEELRVWGGPNPVTGCLRPWEPAEMADAAQLGGMSV